MAKPFVKWVGGKSKLIPQITSYFPNDLKDWEEAIYVEPFIGGGAMFFHMLQTYKNLKTSVINDINHNLITTYRVVKDNVYDLINFLKQLETDFNCLADIERCEGFYISIREKYNESELDDVEIASYFIFLNKTCFNGLYRENKKGLFNVPFGKVLNKVICDEKTLRECSELLRHTVILEGDFENTLNYASEGSLFYFDPPYRPISNTSKFTNYTKDGFNDDSQERLMCFCRKIDKCGAKFFVSNSDDTYDNYFHKLYKEYKFEKIVANRNINSNPLGRGKINEILIHNNLVDFK